MYTQDTQPGLEVQFSNHPTPSLARSEFKSPPATEESENIRPAPRKRPSSFWWPIAFVATVTVVALAAGLGGGLAVRKAQRDCRIALEDLSQDSCIPTIASPLSTGPTGLPSTGPIGLSSTLSSGETSSSSLTLNPTGSTAFWGAPMKTTIPIPVAGDFEYDSSLGGLFGVTYNQELLNVDILSLEVETFELCVEACANWNAYRTGDTPVCQGSSWLPNQSNGGLVYGQRVARNCWLKGPEGDLVPASDDHKPTWFAKQREGATR